MIETEILNEVFDKVFTGRTEEDAIRIKGEILTRYMKKFQETPDADHFRIKYGPYP